MIVPIQTCLDYTKMKKKKRIKPRIIDMVKFLLKGNRRFKTKKDYDRKNKDWKNE